MKERYWAQVEVLVYEALTKKREERTIWLKRRCRSNPAILQEVAGLLKSMGKEDSFDAFLEEPPLGKPGFLEKLLPKPELAWVGEVKGYQLLDVIGEGGMGTVFLAEQFQPFHRRVALKVIRPGLDSKEVLARFAHERQVLGQMKHNHIAHVFEAGTTSMGHPFFTMEYCPGRSLTGWCQEFGLDIRARLELFLQACDGVCHAHRKLVVHRDLKPSNLMVTEQDGQPTVKVIDFGIARVIGSGSLCPGSRNIMIGTPVYMSPEQADGQHFDIDTRCDVYGLGAVLFELLTGMPPFDPARLLGTASISETIRIIREEEPLRPGLRLAMPYAGYQGGNPKELPADLDWIVMKCLARDRDDRYGSVAELMDDIHSFLGNRPVQAAPPGLLYRAHKLVRRQKSLMVALTFLLLALATGVMAFWNRYQAILSKEESYRSARQLEKTISFILPYFDAPQDSSWGPRTTLVEFMQERAPQIQAEFGDQPLTAFTLLSLVSKTFSALGSYDSAELYLDQAQSFAGVFKPDALEPRELDLTRAITYYNAGKYNLALAAFKTGLSDLSHIRPDKRSQELKGLYLRGLANSLSCLGQRSEAEAYYQQALKVQGGSSSEETIQYFKTLYVYGDFLRKEGRFDEAMLMLTESYEGLKAYKSDKDPWTLTAQNNLANLLSNQGHAQAALKMYEQAFETRSAIFNLENPGTLLSLHGVCYTLIETGQDQEARTVCQKAYEQRRKLFGPDHPETLKTGINLALALKNLNENEQSEKLYQQLLDQLMDRLGPDHQDTLTALNNLGDLLVSTHRAAEAEMMLQQLVESRTCILGPDHPDTILAQCTLAESLIQQKKFQMALPRLRSCFERSYYLDPRSIVFSVYRGLYGLCLLHTGHFAGRTLIRESLLNLPRGSYYYNLLDRALRDNLTAHRSKAHPDSLVSTQD